MGAQGRGNPRADSQHGRAAVACRRQRTQRSAGIGCGPELEKQVARMVGNGVENGGLRCHVYASKKVIQEIKLSRA
jgi:hypothetical protein